MVPGREAGLVLVGHDVMLPGGDSAGDLRMSDEEAGSPAAIVDARGRKITRRKNPPRQTQPEKQRLLVDDPKKDQEPERQASKEAVSSSIPPILLSLAGGEAPSIAASLQAKSLPVSEKVHPSNLKPKKADDRRMSFDHILGDIHGQREPHAMPGLKHNAGASNRMNSSSPRSQSPPEQQQQQQQQLRPRIPRKMELAGIGAAGSRHGSKEALDALDQAPRRATGGAQRSLYGGQTARERRRSPQEQHRSEANLYVSQMGGSFTNADARSIVLGSNRSRRS